MAEAAILKVSLGVVQQILGSGLLKEFEMICGVRGDVESLESKFTTLQSVLADANDLRVKNRSVDNWLKKVRDVTYQVDDVLDDFRFEALRREAETGTGNHALKKVRDFFSKSNQLVFLFLMGRKLKKVGHRLDSIAHDSHVYNLNVQDPQPVLNAQAQIGFKDQERETVSSVMEPIIGREKDKEEIIIQLLMTEGPNDEDVFTVIPIVGMGGVGKTTLAQLVYNDDVVKNTFDLLMWVCVSEDFNVKKLTKLLIIEASQTTRSERENQSATNIESLQQLHLQQLHKRLQEKLSGKKFLLVLDDVWNEQWDKWNKLKGFLNTGAKGSKIVATTRIQTVASMMGANKIHNLKGLSDNYCWELFEKKAFCRRRKEEHPELVSIGIEIVKKCDGSPLAAKALGSLLVSKEDQSEWIAVRDSEFWSSDEVGHEILPGLMLSYYHLPSILKPCFVYCALFPKDNKMDEKTLIWLWMAEGLILHSNDQNPEDIGKRYLKELVSRSLFQNKYDGYCVHDLVHDLAKHIAGEACLTMQVDKSIEIPPFCYSLTLICDKNTTACPKEFRQIKSVRTLIFKSNEHEQVEKVLHEMFNTPSKLRALHFQDCPIRELPDSISNMKHLRYICLSGASFKALPQSIGSLRNLQILAISDCSNLASLPASLGGLLSLQILDISHCKNLASLPATLGGLQNLQILKISSCGNLASLPATPGGLQNLQILDISHCKNLASLPATLGGLQNLQILRIFLCDNFASLPATLGGLQNLQILEISLCDNLASLPATLGGLQNLQILKISYCGNLASLPATLGGLQNLQILKISDCDNLASLPPTLGGLQNLQVFCPDCYRFTHMPKEMKKVNKLQKLTRFIVDEERGSSIAELQHLQLEGELKILSLGKLKDASAARAANLKEKGGLRRLHLFKGISKDESLDDVAESLDDVAVEVLEGLEPPQNICELQMSGGTEFPRWLNMGESSFPKLDHISVFCFSRCKHLPPLGQLQLLKTLKISEMSLIEVVGREFCGNNGDGVAFPSLNQITFERMPKWKKWLISEEEDGNRTIGQRSKAFSSLTHLDISSCPELTSLPSLPSLQQLNIEECPKLTSLPSLSSLQKLNIFYNCPELALPSSLTSLQELNINICPELTSLPSLTSLQKLNITHCLKLTSLPSLPSLQKLNIYECPELALLPSLTSLQELKIIRCPELTSLPSLTSLQQLHIYICPKLTLLSSLPALEKLIADHSIELLKSEGSLRGVGSLKCLNITVDGEEVGVMKGLQDLSSVEELDITGFGELTCVMESMQHLLSTVQTLRIFSNAMTVLPETMRGLVSLQSLDISHCDRLSSLGEVLRGLTALRDLTIRDCKELGCMPEYMGSLTSLKSLVISECPHLERRCEREKGEDWHLISHIPNITIFSSYEEEEEEEATGNLRLKKKVISVVKERLRSCFPSTSST